MSQADVETLRVILEAISRGDWDGAIPHTHPDFELTTADRVLVAGTYRGPEEIRRFIEDQWEAFEEVAIEPEEFFERGDQIVVFARVSLRPKGSTAIAQNRIGHVWTMRDGKAARCQVFPQREKALEAAGLSE
jgi:ketosteroid isomerase-like protein